MICRDSSRSYVLDGYSFVNYTSLGTDDLMMVLEWRNDLSVRRWMYNDAPIEAAAHLDFVRRLPSMHDRLYWLMYDPCGIPVATVNLARISGDGRRGEMGYFLAPSQMHRGNGPEMLSRMSAFLFDCVGACEVVTESMADNIGALLVDKFLGREFLFSRKDEGDGRVYYSFILTQERYLSLRGGWTRERFRHVLQLYRQLPQGDPVAFEAFLRSDVLQ